MTAIIKTKNDDAWEQLFNKYSILNEIKSKGSLVIKSSEINEFREARLMTKFDHKFQLPYLFSQNNLSLLPITRGEYVISEIKTFADFSDSSHIKVEEIQAPMEWESLDYKNVTSEASAINCAYVGKLLNIFLDEEELYPTVDGRMSSLEFDFSVMKTTSQECLEVAVKNSQIEIDGGYEGYNSFSLIEAKNTLAPDFLIRQLYYPYRLWEQKLGKYVRNIFLTYTNGIYHFREFSFTNIREYNSIELIREKKYRFKEEIQESLNTELLQYYVENLPLIEEPNIPFPQADSFERVVNLCEVIRTSEDQGVTKDELLLDFYFTDQESLAARQVDYYTNAAAYLGFVEKGKRDNIVVYVLTTEGKELFNLTFRERQIAFVKSILIHNIFRKVLAETFRISDIPPKEKVVSYMKESNLFNVNSESTYHRRASTVTAWIDWILSQVEE